MNKFISAEQIYANAMLGVMKQKQEQIKAKENEILALHKEYQKIITAMIIGFGICILF